MVGGIIMTHGDDTGLRLPPNVAPVQVSWRHLTSASQSRLTNPISRLSGRCESALLIKVLPAELFAPSHDVVLSCTVNFLFSTRSPV